MQGVVILQLLFISPCPRLLFTFSVKLIRAPWQPGMDQGQPYPLDTDLVVKYFFNACSQPSLFLKIPECIFWQFKTGDGFPVFFFPFPTYQAPVGCNIRKHTPTLSPAPVFARGNDVKAISAIIFPKLFFGCWSKTGAELL